MRTFEPVDTSPDLHPGMSECQFPPRLVEVQPFSHQVGGHTCVLQLNERIVCKPFVQNEVTFYTGEPEELKEFTPKYIGEIEVFYDVTDDQKCLLATVPYDLVLEEGLKYKDTFDDVKDTNDVTKRTLASKRNRKRSHSSDLDESVVALKRGCSSGLAVWSRSCIERQISRYGFWANNQPQKFIMLENLVFNFQHPCLMDLKMGRRQFGNDSSEEKRKLLAERCAVTTSATLGYRINGSQVYKCSDSQYVFHDKYVGRELDDRGALSELFHFFHNGYCLRRDVIRGLISRLNRLETYMGQQNAFNFFSCSLLLIYDAINVQGEPNEYTNGTGSGTCDKNEADEVRVADSVHQGAAMGSNTESGDPPKVDVRLIDFAHVSQRTNEENVDGYPDETIVFGLTKLKEGLEYLLTKYV